jgi:phosphatidylglycerol lysyltransferase
VFPLEVLHLSRFLVLLLGFALVITSINLYRAKRRAFQAALLLAAFSILFHLTKGHDDSAALWSLVLLAILLLARRHFTVRSGPPDLRGGLLRLGIAGLVAVAYGTAGFWYFDPPAFGVDFTFAQALRSTLLTFSLIGDPHLAPHTRHAMWFVDSLDLMTATWITYALVALFRPALYVLRIVPQERARAAALLARHGRSAIDYFKVWPDKSLFFADRRDCFLAYRVGAGYAIVLGDPVGPEEAIEGCVQQFAALCREYDWELAFHQALPDFLPIYARLGFRRLKVGDDAIIDLTRFGLEGREGKEFRQTVHHVEREGVRLVSFEPPIPEEVLLQLESVSSEWLRIPGRRERRFTLGLFDRDYVRATPVLAAADAAGKILAFVNLIPSYRPGEATIDLMRRRDEGAHGLMDYLMIRTLLACRERGFARFNFGMAPMSGFQEREEATPEERAVHFFFQRLNFLFSYHGLRAYKAKFAHAWEPRYAIYRRALDLPRLAVALARVTEIRP